MREVRTTADLSLPTSPLRLCFISPPSSFLSVSSLNHAGQLEEDEIGCGFISLQLENQILDPGRLKRFTNLLPQKKGVLKIEIFKKLNVRSSNGSQEITLFKWQQPT